MLREFGKDGCYVLPQDLLIRARGEERVVVVAAGEDLFDYAS